MADKMKEQQKRQEEEARKQAAKKQTAETKAAPSYGKRTTRSKKEDAGEIESATSKNTKTKTSAGKKDAKRAPKENISNYFKKADVNVSGGNPTVQEALEKAAGELEARPTAIGEQEGLVATEQPEFVTGGKMRQYQLEGLEWMKSLWMNGLCGILADEMGLGKTIQAISLIAFFKERNISGPFLIAAPLSTVSNWVDEFARWTPSIRTILYHGNKDDREKLRRSMKLKDQKNMEFPVVCTSYEICMNDRKYLSQYQWRYIIVVSFIYFHATGLN
jgi:ATP-dependent DNA helicase